MDKRESVYMVLRALGVEFQVTEHPAVHTIEELDALGFDVSGDVCKNLFLRDAAGKRHFLVVLQKDKKADLKSLQAQLGTSRLGFASEERLYKFLRLTKGEVTPLAAVNDTLHAVEVVFDRGLEERLRLGVHPGDNTATVWLSFESLKSYIRHCGNTMHYVDI